jgi:hypothetical protein
MGLLIPEDKLILQRIRKYKPIIYQYEKDFDDARSRPLLCNDNGGIHRM